MARWSESTAKIIFLMMTVYWWYTSHVSRRIIGQKIILPKKEA